MGLIRTTKSKVVSLLKMFLKYERFYFVMNQ